MMILFLASGFVHKHKHEPKGTENMYKCINMDYAQNV